MGVCLYVSTCIECRFYTFHTHQKSATLLRDVLDSNHIIDFITANSSGQVKGKSRSPAITWSSLFRNVVGYVFKEADAVAKLEEKASHSSSGLQSKKKVSELGVESCRLSVHTV